VVTPSSGSEVEEQQEEEVEVEVEVEEEENPPKPQRKRAHLLPRISSSDEEDCQSPTGGACKDSAKAFQVCFQPCGKK
jgi:hypothetical protein